MPRVKTYRSVNEIMEVFKITLGTVNSLIKKYKVDSFSSKGMIQINAKDFYKVYVTYCNPSLFGTGEEKKKTKMIDTHKIDNADIFQKLFGTPYKKATKKVLVNPALIGAKDHDLVRSNSEVLFSLRFIIATISQSILITHILLTMSTHYMNGYDDYY